MSLDGKHTKINVSPDSISSVIVAKKGLLHDVHKSDSGPISGFTREVSSLDKVGYLIIPNRMKPGAALMKAYVDKWNLPTRVDALISKCHSTIIGVDISLLCCEPKDTKPTLMPYDDRHKGIMLTNKLVAKVGGTHLCVLASNVEVSSTYAKNYAMVRYEDGSVVIVPKAAVSKLDAEMVTVMTTCCLSDYMKQIEASKCAKHPGFVKLACSAAHYHKAKQKGQVMARQKLALDKEEVAVATKSGDVTKRYMLMIISQAMIALMWAK